jgi:hypothetical protein
MPLRNLSCPITAILSSSFRINYPPTKMEVPFMSDSLLHYAAPAGIVLVFTVSSGKEYVKSCLISCLKFGTSVPDILAVLSVQISADVMAATEPPPRQKACAPKDVPTMRNLSPRPSNTISNPCDILKRHTIIASTSFGQNILKLEAEPQALDLKP